MEKFSYVITDELGIHARPAGLFVKAASGFQSKITIGTVAKEVDAKRIMGIMSLGVKKGDTITVCADGTDESDAIKALEDFMKTNL